MACGRKKKEEHIRVSPLSINFPTASTCFLRVDIRLSRVPSLAAPSFPRSFVPGTPYTKYKVLRIEHEGTLLFVIELLLAQPFLLSSTLFLVLLCF
jgi:hypothetical protein